MKGKFTLAVVSVLCSFAVHINAQTSCSAITGTGCNLDGPVSGTGNSCLDYTFDLPALPPLPYCTLDFDTFSGDCQANFAAGVTAPPTGLSAAAFCALLVSDCCSTPSPTFQPTNNPTRSPSPAPSKLPTPSPTGNPTRTPTRTPTTLAPSNSPSPNPTSAPQVAAPGFFEVQENVYMVSGIGGGVLLLAIVGALFMRSRRQGGSASKAVMEEPKTSPEMRGKKGLTPSLKVKIEQEVENSIFDWEKHIDKTSGEVYFFNPKTNESRWDPPEIVSKTAKKILENVSKEL